MAGTLWSSCLINIDMSYSGDYKFPFLAACTVAHRFISFMISCAGLDIKVCTCMFGKQGLKFYKSFPKMKLEIISHLFEICLYFIVNHD